MLNASTVPSAVDWHDIDWRRAEDHLYQMQVQLVKHYRNGDWSKIISTQRMIANSFDAKCLAVKRVTSNRGKRTAGVDGVLWSTPNAKMDAVFTLKKRGYKAAPLKRVYIDKGRGDGSTRPLGIPTLHDRAMQALYLFTLEPIAEASADGRSYGFRRYRCAHDAITNLRVIYNKHYTNGAVWAIDADIKGFFDNISHDWLLEKIPMDKTILRKFLKAGFIEMGQWQSTERGTPQGGVISPTIANMVLDGLEKVLQNTYWRRTPNGVVDLRNNKFKVNMVRYADDFIVTCNDRDKCDEILEVVKTFLAERGVELSESKTKIVHIDEGFDFLGFNIRRYYRHKRYKLLVTPSKKKVKHFLNKIRQIVRDYYGASQATLIQRLNPIIRGWAYYYRYSNAKRVFGDCDHYIWESLWHWAKRRHREKGKNWVQARYWHKRDGREWRFIAVEKGVETARLLQFANFKIRNWRQLRLSYNAFEHRDEIEAALIKRGAILMQSRFKKVYNAQKGVCPVCNQPIYDPNHRYEIHHNWPKKWGGRESVYNLWYIHEACHFSYHEQNTVVSLKSQKIRYYLDKYSPLRKVDSRRDYSDEVKAILSGAGL